MKGQKPLFKTWEFTKGNRDPSHGSFFWCPAVSFYLSVQILLSGLYHGQTDEDGTVCVELDFLTVSLFVKSDNQAQQKTKADFVSCLNEFQCQGWHILEKH